MPYLVVDIGTSGCKGAVIMENGELLKVTRRKYPFIIPQIGQIELSPYTIVEKVKEVIKELVHIYKDIRAIAVTSLGEAFVLLDEKEKPIYNSFTYLDKRGEEQLQKIQEKVGAKEIQRTAGTPLKTMYSLVKYLWMYDNIPMVKEKTKKCLLYCDYIGYLLTGERIIDPTLASRTMLLNLKKGQWNEEMMQKFGIEKHMFSDIRETGELVGRVRTKIAEELGLKAGIPLYNGCHDQCSAMLGAGVWKSGQCMAGEGSSESLQIVLNEEQMNAIESEVLQFQLSIAPFPFYKKYVLTLGQDTYGTCIRWFTENFMDPDPNVYDKLEKMGNEKSGGILFFPLFSEYENGKCGGVFMGLSPLANKKKLYRAMLEGLCMETKRNLCLLPGIQKKISGLVATGGCSQSNIHMQLKANILNKPISVLKSEEAGLNGLSMICSVAMHDYSNFEEAREFFVNIRETYFPKGDYRELENRYLGWRRYMENFTEKGG